MKVIRHFDDVPKIRELRRQKEMETALPAELDEGAPLAEIPGPIAGGDSNPADIPAAQQLPSQSQGPADRADAVLQLAIDNLSFIKRAVQSPDLLAGLVRSPTPAPAEAGAEDGTDDPVEENEGVGVPVATVQQLAIDLLEFHPEAGEVAQQMLEACMEAFTAALANGVDIREQSPLEDRIRNLEGVLDVTLGRVQALENEIRVRKQSDEPAYMM